MRVPYNKVLFKGGFVKIDSPFLTNKTNLMPDISMCLNKKCPVKEQCYRFTAKSSDYQSYSSFEVTSNKGCKYFWDNSEYKNEKHGIK